MDQPPTYFQILLDIHYTPHFSITARRLRIFADLKEMLSAQAKEFS